MKTLRNMLCLFLAFSLLAVPGLFSAAAADGGQETVDITGIQDFLSFAESCSIDSYSSGRRFRLVSDIDLEGRDFSPIQIFLGVFDGNGHSITGLSISREGSSLGLFRRVGEDAVILNLAVAGSVTPSGTALYIGGIAGENSGTISNCSFSGTIKGIRYVGGIAGSNTGIISACAFGGSLTAEREAGGIAGTSSGNIYSCSNFGDICSTPIDAAPVTEFNINTFDISQITTEDFVNISNIGGMAGYSSGVVSSCTNSGTVGYKFQGFNVGGIAGKTSGYISDCSNSGTVLGQRDIGGIAGQLEPHIAMEFSEDLLQELQTEMDSLSTTVNSLSGSVTSMVSGSAGKVSEMTGYTAAIAQEVGKIVSSSIPELPDIPEGIDPSEIPGLIIPEITIPENPDLSVINYNMNLLLRSSTELTSIVDGAAAGLSGGFSTLNNQINSIRRIFGKAIDNASSSRDLTEDISVRDAYTSDTGAISGCRNTGTVKADTNAGGILGISAVELSFDVAEELDVAEYFYSDARTTFFAVIRQCENTGSVNVRDSCSGGITGKMAQGAILDCSSRGDVSCTNGDYCGGISGISNGSILNCCARSDLSASKYIGGIAGSGTGIKNCLSSASVSGGSEYIGAIAGSVSGELADNRYIDRGFGAVDGASYAGKTDPVDRAALAADASVPAFFLPVTVNFMVEDELYAIREVDYGGYIEEAPEVPADSRGRPWKWDPLPTEALYENISISGHYVSPVPVLSSGEKRPVYLVEGEFSEGQSLAVSDLDTSRLAGLPEGELVRSATLLVEGYSGDLTVHMRAPSDGTVFLVSSEGSLIPAESERDGSFIVFKTGNGSSFLYVTEAERQTPVTALVIVAAVFAADAVLLIIILSGRKRRRRKTARQQEQ
ncbi:MAG: hypothetical protein IJH53_03755 [Oscillospiraceae bacterium]|nr:hypothetical protein [Oscillospiraceae bacterium]